MRDEFVHFAIARATTGSVAERPWSLDDARHVVNYFLKNWHQPELIRRAWIDGGLKGSIDPELGSGSTGSCEGSFKHLDDQMFKLLRNRDVCTVASKMGGLDANGEPTAGVLDGEEKRYREDAFCDSRGGVPKRFSVDIRLCEARAALAFLSGIGDSVIIDGDVAFVPFLNELSEQARIVAHAARTSPTDAC